MQESNLYDDYELLRLIAEGNEKAFAELYQRYLPALHTFLFKMLKSEQPVQEVIQETLIRIWLNRDKLPEVEYPRAWVSKVALRECYRFLRKKGLQSTQELSDHLSSSVLNEGQNTLSLKETKQIIHQTIENLPSRRKLIYIMSREQGLKIPEIATKLGLSPGYVKNALVFALKEIRIQLSKHGRTLIFIINFNFF